MYKLPRRAFLQSVVGSLLLAPILRVRALEAQNSQPKRFIVFNAAGSFVPEWFPTGQGRDFNLRRPNTALEQVKSNLLFMSELRHSVTSGNHHELGMATAYSSAGSTNGDITIDQVVARHLQNQTNAAPIKFIAQGLYGGRNNPVRSLMSYDAPGRRIDPEESAVANYNRIFNGATQQTVTSVKSVRDEARIKVFDIAKEDLNDIKRYLGQEEKSKLEYHIDSLQSLSRELASNVNDTPAVTACNDVELLGDRNSVRIESQLVNGVSNLMNLTSAAIQCDRTRVVTMQVGFSGDHYNGLRGFKRNPTGNFGRDSWHDWIHHEASNKNHELYGEWMWMSELWSEKLAGLAKSLQDIPEGNGTMLDNTIILWGSEMGIGHSHNPRNVPYLVIGGRNMGVNTGQFLKFDRAQEHAKLLTSIKHAFGIMDSGMGNRPNSGPLAGVLN